MLRDISITTLIAALLLLPGGCERKATTDAKAGGAAPAVAEEGHEGHEHASQEDHDSDTLHTDEHAGSDVDAGHAHGGAPRELGTRDIAGRVVKVLQYGPATGDTTELVFEVVVTGAEPPTAVRLLVRDAAGAESLKVKAEKTGEQTYDAHVGELPDALGEGSVVVVEIETPSGTDAQEFPLQS